MERRLLLASAVMLVTTGGNGIGAKPHRLRRLLLRCRRPLHLLPPTPPATPPTRVRGSIAGFAGLTC